jgi:cellulose synthase (UDP-forming)
MPLSQLGKKNFPAVIWQKLSRIQLATLVMLATVGVAGTIVAAWFSGQEPIDRLFWQLNQWQEHPSMWVVAPMMVGKYLLFWTTILLAIVWLIMQVSPLPQPWSRTVVVGILAVLTVRYLLWRSLATLNLTTPLNGVFSVGLFLLELLLIVVGIIQLILLLRVRDRRSQAERLSQAVI